MLAKMYNLKYVVWIGVHIDILEYMQMSEVRFDFNDIRLVLNSYQKRNLS
jgi:hypothetical protein